ncbi:MAG TPA: LysM peptidoglycan-binding domain-containing protein, partial [Candidatus Dormibacteraeota bacterium]|nr:LysM peptidoglycan-binding domain-containing protein [Candidatus Dormibacteraeota bacterium]
SGQPIPSIDPTSGGTAAPSNPISIPLSSGAPAVASSSPQQSSPTSDYAAVTAAPAAPITNGASYTVVPGDTMWGIAEKNGIPLSQLEALNPQIEHPELILPGQNVNIGGGGSSVSLSPDQSQPSAVVVGPSSSNDTSGAVTTGTIGSPGASGGGAVGFPEKSSYSNIGSEVEKVVNVVAADAKAQGWTDGTGSGTADIVKGVFEVDTHTSTDPLKINDEKK